ncbi:MAG: GIY-YIG nuclease family protein [Pirellulaceae bacterium]|nr:GIY-YIG nuclease family protein [Pirellulaceae bacterium]
MAGRTIKLFLTGGRPNGLTIAELQQWSGIALTCPRSELKALLDRSEAAKPGLYILTGQDDQALSSAAYIGEAENISDRLKEHHRPKKHCRTSDFWDRVCFFTQKDDNLTKAHVRYLEAQMIDVAKEAKRMTLINERLPNLSNISLPESDLADMKYFFAQMQLILPTLGIYLLHPQPIVTSEDALASRPESPLFSLSGPNTDATAKLVNGEFVVLKGSLVRKKSTPSLHTSNENIRQTLLTNQVLKHHNEEQYCFTENHAFSSPSTAAGVVLGRSSNGRSDWKVKDTGQNYGDWEEAKIGP